MFLRVYNDFNDVVILSSKYLVKTISKGLFKQRSIYKEYCAICQWIEHKTYTNKNRIIRQIFTLITPALFLIIKKRILFVKEINLQIKFSIWYFFLNGNSSWT